MGSLSAPTKFAYQTFQVLGDENPPTLNVAHEVFSETGGVLLHTINIMQTNTPTNPATIDVIIIKDGTTYETDPAGIGDLAHNTEYAVFMAKDQITFAPYLMDILSIAARSHNLIKSFNGVTTENPFKGHAISVSVRQDSAIAAGARIRTKCTYEILRVI